MPASAGTLDHRILLVVAIFPHASQCRFLGIPEFFAHLVVARIRRKVKPRRNLPDGSFFSLDRLNA